MQAEEKSGTGEVEAPQVSEAVYELADDIRSVFLCCRTDQEGFAEICTMIAAFVAQEVQAALGHVEYIHMLESDDKADKAVEAERARIVAALNARKQTAAISEERANKNNKPHIALVYHNEIEVLDEAIAIAKGEEEGG